MSQDCFSCLQTCISVFNTVEKLKKDEADLTTDRRYLEDNLDRLERIMNEANNRNVGNRWEADWLRTVESLPEEVRNILAELGRVRKGNCLYWCRIYRRNLVHRTSVIRRRLEERLGTPCAREIESNFPGSTDPVVRRLDQRVFTINRSYREFWRKFDDKNVHIIGIHGMIGSGKSTFLEKINDHFYDDRRGFDKVIFVPQSSISDVRREVRRIQDEIFRRLGATLPQHNESRRQELCNILSRMNVVLLLDHLLPGVMPTSLGVPAPASTEPKICKVVFTARRKSTWIEATVEHIELDLLSKEDARMLIKNKAWKHIPNTSTIRNASCSLVNKPRTVVNNSGSIEDLAHEIADKCDRLPLALVEIGKSLRGKSNPAEWKIILRRLGKQDEASKDDPEGRVYARLKEAYDSLRDCQSEDDFSEKKGFLFCSLFPEDHPIEVNELKRHWMLEKYLGRVRGDRALDVYFERAVAIVEELKRAHLLTSSGSDHQSCVKMHRQFHYMARWVARSEGEERNLVQSGGCLDDDLKACQGRVKRIFLMGTQGKLKKINCPSLSTLVIRESQVEEIKCDLLDSIRRTLKVLDLARCTLPKFELNSAKDFYLQYLNLSHTDIESFPFKLGALRSLKFLDLSFTKSLIMTSLKSLSVLTNLQLLNLYYCGPYECSKRLDVSSWLFDEVEKLRHLSDLAVTIHGHSDFQKLENFSKRDVIHSMVITKCNDERLKLEFIATARKLEVLHVIYCSSQLSWGQQAIAPEQYFRKLREVELKHCEKLKDFTWLKYARALQSLKIVGCKNLTHVINLGRSGRANLDPLPFENLSKLELRDLKDLGSICTQDLPFTFLKSIKVRECGKLKTIPIAQNRNRRTRPIIDCKSEWWRGIRDDARKSRLRPELSD